MVRVYACESQFLIIRCITTRQGKWSADLKGVIALLCVTVCSAHAAFEPHVIDVRASAMGGTGCATNGTCWGALLNPAGLSGVAEPVIGFSYSPSPFGLTELRRSAFCLALPLPWCTTSLEAVRYGFDLYRELTVALGFAIPIGGTLCAGFTCTVNHLFVSGYGSTSALGLNAGFLWSLTQDVQLGAAAMNFNGPTLGATGEKLPQSMLVGVRCTPVAGGLIQCDINMDIRFPAELRIGFEYEILGALAFRAGVSGEPSTIAVGAGVHISAFSADYSLSRHEVLGFTHQIGLSLRVN